MLLVPVAGPAQESLPRDVAITAIPGVIDDAATWHLAWQGTNNADGIVGLPDGSVLFAQEQPRLVGRLDEHDAYSVYIEDTRGVGSLSIDAQGRLIAVERSCTDPGRRAPTPCTEPTAISIMTPARRVLADAFEGAALGRLNDLVADSRGGVYFTVGHAFRIDERGRVTQLDEDLQANGIMLSPDERTLYVTNRRQVVAFDVAADGTTSDRREFALLEAGGLGDGMAVDERGRLYVTSNPGVQVFADDGAYLGLIPTPRPAISAAFSGPSKRRLYVVASGAALGPNGSEFATPEGVRNNAKTIYRIETATRGYAGRAK